MQGRGRNPDSDADLRSTSCTALRTTASTAHTGTTLMRNWLLLRKRMVRLDQRRKRQCERTSVLTLPPPSLGERIYVTEPGAKGSITGKCASGSSQIHFNFVKQEHGTGALSKAYFDHGRIHVSPPLHSRERHRDPVLRAFQWSFGRLIQYLDLNSPSTTQAYFNSKQSNKVSQSSAPQRSHG